jgi:hypothetical protein
METCDFGDFTSDLCALRFLIELRKPPNPSVSMEKTSSPPTGASSNPTMLTVRFDDQVVRYFVIATAIWGFVGMLVGALIALQMPFWQANLGQYLTFGRLRPLHTNAE